MNLYNLFSRKRRFSNNYANYQFILSGGKIISDSDISYTNTDEIEKNICVRSIINKQASIISEATLEIREKIDNGKDKITQNKSALKFLEFIDSPNSFPSPLTRKHIFEHLMTGYWVSGASCLIFRFNGSIKMNNWINTLYGYDFNYNNNDGSIDVTYEQNNKNNQKIKFKKNKFGLYTFEEENIKYVLYFICDFQLKSPFIEHIDFILLNNLVIKYNSDFFSNSCIPATIVSISYKDKYLETTGGVQSDEDKISFKNKIDQIKNAFANNDEKAKQLFLSDPNLQIDVKTLSLPNNSGETKSLYEITSESIFSIVDGGSRSGYQGLNDYSGNTLTKQKEIYDGAFRLAESLISDSMTIFLRKLLLMQEAQDIKGLDVNNLIVDFNTTTVEIYRQHRIQEATNIWNNNGCQLNEYRKILSSADDAYADFVDLPNIGDKTQVELKGEQTRSNFAAMNKN